jgi:hypothetical protein
MVVRRSAFLAFSSAQNEGGLKGEGRKWKVEASIFTSRKQYEFTRDA